MAPFIRSRVLLLIACSVFGISSPAQSDSMVQVQYSRLVKWAANRVVGDSLLRELAQDFARQQTHLVQAFVVIDRDSVIMKRQADEIQGWKDAEAFCQGQRKDERKRAKAGKILRFLEGLLIGGAVGIIATR